MNNLHSQLIGRAVQAGWRQHLVCWLLACLVLFPGCATSRKEAQRNQELLARHPAQETRMSARPESSYQPAGVWRIRGRHNTVYLAGTCHVLSEKDIPFPSPFYAAYGNSEEIYLEMKGKNPSFFTQLRMIFKMRQWIKSHQAELACPAGRKLGDYLTTNTVARLKEHYGKQYSLRERLSPLFAAFLGGVESMAQEVDDNGGVDETFELMALRDNKPIHELDDNSVWDSVVLALDSMLMDLSVDISRRGADVVIREEVLGDAKEEADNMDWRRGDLPTLEELHQAMKEENPTLYTKLLDERNRKWMGKIEAALQADKNVMVLVGVMHMGGKEGLLALLKKSGYKVEQMYGVDRPKPQGIESPPGSRRAGAGRVSSPGPITLGPVPRRDSDPCPFGTNPCVIPTSGMDLAFGPGAIGLIPSLPESLSRCSSDCWIPTKYKTKEADTALPKA